MVLLIVIVMKKTEGQPATSFVYYTTSHVWHLPVRLIYTSCEPLHLERLSCLLIMLYKVVLTFKGRNPDVSLHFVDEILT